MKYLAVIVCVLCMCVELIGCGLGENAALATSERQEAVLSISSVLENPDSESEIALLRDRYPYVSRYSIADTDPNMTWEKLTSDTILVKFKVIERLEDEDRLTDMMGGVEGITSEDLAFFEEAGMRYLPTTLEHYRVEVLDSTELQNTTMDICHNVMFGEMYGLLEPGKEFATFLTPSEEDLICNFETLYYVTEDDTLLSVIDYPVSAEIDGVAWDDLVDAERD